MGARGPVPNRTEDLSRERDANRGDRSPVTKGKALSVTIPNAGRDWHPVAVRLWKGMKSSGQAEFFQDSDWAYAYMVMEELSHHQKSAKRSSMMFSAIDSALSKLLVTEADRRRARIELEAEIEEGPDAAVVAIDEYRAMLSVVPDDDEDEDEELS